MSTLATIVDEFGDSRRFWQQIVAVSVASVVLLKPCGLRSTNINDQRLASHFTKFHMNLQRVTHC